MHIKSQIDLMLTALNLAQVALTNFPRWIRLDDHGEAQTNKALKAIREAMDAANGVEKREVPTPPLSVPRPGYNP